MGIWSRSQPILQIVHITANLLQAAIPAIIIEIKAS